MPLEKKLKLLTDNYQKSLKVNRIDGSDGSSLYLKVQQMTYYEQLQTPEWAKLRKLILARDNYNCQNCKNQKYLTESNISVGLFQFDSLSVSGSNSVAISLFEKDTISCMVNNDTRQFLVAPSILYFNIVNDDWLNLIASRKLTGIELNQYIKEPVDNIAKVYVRNFQELYPDFEKGKSKIPLLDNLAFSSENEQEIDKIIRLKLRSVSPDWQNYVWVYAKGLHIHHQYYQYGKLAWEYPKEALTTLCWSCHTSIHANLKIEVRDEIGKVLQMRDVCGKCYGAGWLPQYMHVEHGICFNCNGNRFIND